MPIHPLFEKILARLGFPGSAEGLGETSTGSGAEDFADANPIASREDEAAGSELTSSDESSLEHDGTDDAQAADGTGGRQPATLTFPSEDDLPDLTDVRFMYRPLLEVNKKTISTFICLPLRELIGGRQVTGYEVLNDPANTGHIFNLDMLTLQIVAAELIKIAETGKRFLVAMPVHVETITDRRHRSRYLKMHESCIASHSDRLAFEVMSLPADMPGYRLEELVSALLPKAHAVITRCHPGITDLASYQKAGLHGVVMDLQSSEESEQELMNRMDGFVRDANVHGLKSYIQGVQTPSLYTAAVSAGFDYIAGYAMPSITESAVDLQSFEPESSHEFLFGPEAS